MPLLVIYASYRVNTKSFNRSTFSHDHLWIYLKWIMWCNAIWHHAFLLLCHVILFHKTNILLQTLLSHNHVFTHHICNCAPPFTLPEPLKEIYMNKSMGWRYWILLSALMKETRSFQYEHYHPNRHMVVSHEPLRRYSFYTQPHIQLNNVEVTWVPQLGHWLRNFKSE